MVIEIISNIEGGEDGRKLKLYAKIGVPNYVIFDPEQHQSDEVLRVFRLHKGRYKPSSGDWFPEAGLGVKLWDGTFENWEGLHKRRYKPIAGDWFPEVGLGIKLWDGTYEQLTDTWLRWCDHDGEAIPTGAERAERLAQLLREHGIEPE